VVSNITFTVYPNPNFGEFSVDFSGIENNHEVELYLQNGNGKVIYKSQFYSQNMGVNTVKITPDEKLSSGIYLCTLISEGIKYSVKVIVN
jgi:hypothetical protein